LPEMVMTEGTRWREIRKSLKLDITVAMLVTCVQEGHPSLSIIKFDKRAMLWHWSAQSSCKDRNLWFYKRLPDTYDTLGTEISVV